MRRSERIAAITRLLVASPYRIFSLTDFAARFDAAKSTLSEDLSMIRETFAQLELGKIETLSGAAGGVRYMPEVSNTQLTNRIERFCAMLADPQRILPGGFIYLNDFMNNPTVVAEIGEIFCSHFYNSGAEYVVTVEMSGIPIALMTAHSLNIPLVIVRRVSRLTEGSVLTMNYLSGSSRRVQTMSLSRRGLPAQSKVLVIDDFMKAGGTLKGLTELMGEFECEVVGKGVLIETAQPEQKLVSDYISYITLKNVDEEQQKVYIEPASWIGKQAE